MWRSVGKSETSDGAGAERLRSLSRLAATVLTALGCLVLLPAAAHAQSAISGIVRDVSGAVLPGVTVEAASPVLIEKHGRSSATKPVATRWSICDPALIR